MMTPTLQIAAYGIAYKDDPARPSTAGGRAIAHPFVGTREQCEVIVNDMRAECWLHVVEFA